MVLLPPTLTTVGKIVSKHGYKGSVIIHFNSSFNGEIHTGDYLFVVIDQKGVPFLIESINADAGIVKLQSIDSETRAQEILGCTVGIPFSESHSQNDSNELIGYLCFDQNELPIGSILRIEEFPGHMMLVVFRENQEILIPLIEDWIIEIDQESRTLHLEIPDGLLDLENDAN